MSAGKLGTTHQINSGAANQAWAGPFPVCNPSTVEKILQLRELVYRSEPSLVNLCLLNSATFRDTHDAHADHWIITVEESIVAAARLCIHCDAGDLPNQDLYHHMIAGIPVPIASLNRMVVHPSMRRQGLSRALTAARIKAARSRGARSMIVEAAPNRIPPLWDLGFRELGHTVGEPYLVRFSLMYLDLSV